MASSNDSPKKPPDIEATPDDYFRKQWGVCPMAALFIALPTRKVNFDLLYAPKANLRRTAVELTGGRVSVRDSTRKYIKDGEEVDGFFKKLYPFRVPCGMAGRRVFLNYFNRAYLYGRPKSNFRSKKKSAVVIKNAFGYDHRKSRHYKTREGAVLRNMLGAKVSFTDIKTNEKYGLVKRLDMHDQLFLVSSTPSNKLESIEINKDFMFSCRIPVDFNHVMGTQKRSGFWNVYVFFVDFMRCVPKKKEYPFPWKIIHILFKERGGSEENFRYVFLNYAKEVEKIYPRIEGKYRSDSKNLYLKYAPPPI